MRSPVHLVRFRVYVAPAHVSSRSSDRCWNVFERRRQARSRRFGKEAGQHQVAILVHPLDVTIPAWTRDPQGYYLGGNEMAISPQDLSKFAEMIRQGGRVVASSRDAFDALVSIADRSWKG